MSPPSPAPSKSSASTKLRAVSSADGRIGWPDVVEYELAEGPEAGKRLPVPPSFERHPHPDPRALWRAGQACERATLAYCTIVHDQEAYDELKRGGYIYGEQHWGKRPAVIDNRARS